MKEELKMQSTALSNDIYRLESLIRQEINDWIIKDVAPLRHAADAKEKEIGRLVQEKYSQQLKSLKLAHNDVQNQLTAIKKEENTNKWFSPETILYEWGCSRYSTTWKLTGQRGVVKIYTNDLSISELSKWERPKEGDIIILLLKKDGSIGKNYIRISKPYEDTLSWQSKNWLPEGVQKTTEPD